MTQRLPTAVARKGFASVLRDSAKGERIKLTRYNKTIAVIIPKKDLDDLEDCQKARRQAQGHGHGEDENADHKHGGRASRAPTGKHPKVETKSDP